MGFPELLRALSEGEVEFIVVGGVAAILQGVEISTVDLDIVPEMSAGNVDRLSRTLAGLDARYQDPLGRMFRPEPGRLLQNRLNLLTTSAGRLDVLKSVGKERGFSELWSLSSAVEFDGTVFRVLSLEGLIEAKEVAGREKDLVHLRLLRAALELQTRDAKPGGEG